MWLQCRVYRAVSEKSENRPKERNPFGLVAVVLKQIETLALVEEGKRRRHKQTIQPNQFQLKKTLWFCPLSVNGWLSLFFATVSFFRYLCFKIIHNTCIFGRSYSTY